jgi:hypothetical protein
LIVTTKPLRRHAQVFAHQFALCSDLQNSQLAFCLSYPRGREMGSKALGFCLRRHRGRRTQQVLADMLGKSLRWVLYAESGRADLGWTELVAIATALGPSDGRAFLDDAMALLYEEAEMGRLNKELLDALQRRDFLAILGAGAAIDMERLGRTLQGLGVDSHVSNEMAKLTRLYVDQSRQTPPGVVVSALQVHLRDYLELAIGAPEQIGRSLKGGAAEAALLAGILVFRLGHAPEASHYWMMAKGLAEESGHTVVKAFVFAAQGSTALSPGNFGGVGGDAKQARRLLDQALSALGGKARGIAPATIHAWRSVQHAILNDSDAASRDLELASRLLGNSRSSMSSSDEPTGLAARTQADVEAERAVCAVYLRRAAETINILEPGQVANHHPSPGWKVARMADLAAAYAQRGEADRAVTVLLEATDIAVGAKEPWRLRRVKGIRQTQVPASYTSEALGELDLKLGSALHA